MKEKQIIEDMAKHCHFCEKGKCLLLGDEAVDCDTECDICEFAKSLYNAGYRKQSEGEWIQHQPYHQTDDFYCSLCGAIAPVDCLKEDFYESNFCPNCGAKMKGGAE